MIPTRTVSILGVVRFSTSVCPAVDFIDALDENREPLVNGKAGLEAVKIILAAYKSQKTGLPIKFSEFKEFSTLDMGGLNV